MMTLALGCLAVVVVTALTGWFAARGKVREAYDGHLPRNEQERRWGVEARTGRPYRE